MWRSVDSGEIHPDCPPLRVLGPQWRGGRRSPGPGVARQPRSRRSGWSPHVGQENHHQTRLPAATVRQVKYFYGLFSKSIFNFIVSGLWCPDWAPWGHTTLTNDIAIVELMRSAPTHSPHVSPIQVASFSPPPGTTAWVGGWGLDGHHPTKSLNLAPMAVQKDSFRECKQQMSAGKMCVIGKDFGGPCPGDSGSPLVIYSKELGPQLIGLVSNGAESCKAGLPGIFTRVSHYYDWIHVAMQTARRVGGLGHHRHRWHDSHRSWNSFDNTQHFHRNHRPVSNAFYTKSKHRPQTMFGRYYQNYPNRYY